MPRAFALALLAAFCAGCAGAGGLLATVPPPVELAPSSVIGLVELPTAGTYRGDLVVEHVTLTEDEAGAWHEMSAVPVVGGGRAQAEIEKDGTIRLSGDGSSPALFRGILRAFQASGHRSASTTATLTAFDGTSERYPYVLTAGDPQTLRIAARAKLARDGNVAEFDRYTFVLRS